MAPAGYVNRLRVLLATHRKFDIVRWKAHMQPKAEVPHALLQAGGPEHGYGIAPRIEQTSHVCPSLFGKNT